MHNGVMHTTAVAVISNRAIPAVFYLVRTSACQILPPLAGHDVFEIIVHEIAEPVVIQAVKSVAGEYITLGTDGDKMILTVFAHNAI